VAKKSLLDRFYYSVTLPLCPSALLSCARPWPELFACWAGLVCLAALITRTMLQRIRIMDLPNQRSSHAQPRPKSGGVAIVATFVAGLLLLALFGHAAMISTRYSLGFVASALAIAAISLYDDMHGKSFTMKLMTQSGAALLVMTFGLVIDQLAMPWFGMVALGGLAYPITFLWLVGLTNAFNFMDGLDGLAGGVALIAGLAFAFITLDQGSTFIHLVSWILVAGVLGFMIFNFPPARIFMGDVGSAFLGFVFATMAIIAARYDQSHTSFLVMPLLLFNFIFDTTFTLARRLLAGQRLTEAHRDHLYQRFNQLGYSHRTVSLVHYGMGLGQGIGAYVMVHISGSERLFVFLPFLGMQIAYAVWVMRKFQASR